MLTVILYRASHFSGSLINLMVAFRLLPRFLFMGILIDLCAFVILVHPISFPLPHLAVEEGGR